jgi:hypothetical protein
MKQAPLQQTGNFQEKALLEADAKISHASVVNIE